MKIFLKSIFWLASFFITLLILISAYYFAFFFNFFGTLETAGKNLNKPYPDYLLQSKIQSQLKHTNTEKQILFGDTHVHSTYSTDAFLWSLKNFNGEGPHLMAEACDYARFCSAIDFWVNTDHAEASTPRKWAETIKAVQNCEAVHKGDRAKDLISFVGYEWTQINPDNKDDHYGHKNVLFLETDEKLLPEVPFGAAGYTSGGFRDRDGLVNAKINMLSASVVDFSNRNRYADFIAFYEEVLANPDCDPNDMNYSDCYKSVFTPKDLFSILKTVDSDSIVIPHGNTWGYYTPTESSWDKQLLNEMHDPSMQISIEVFSGHGNSEEFRNWTGTISKNGLKTCPSPTEDYLPSCWRAGEIIQERCLKNGSSEEICLARAELARQTYIEGGQYGHWSVMGAEPADWLDSGQCKDCFVPAFNMRPNASVQYALALRKFEGDKINSFDFGFIASSDNHRARPGTGYKAIDRLVTTEANGPSSEFFYNNIYPEEEKSDIPWEVVPSEINTASELTMFEAERQSSFFTTGGLAAVHVSKRDRKGIWEGFKNKETYATSGPRILLWFDVINSKYGRKPMGSKIEMSENPVFEVKAVGSFKQKPGCPDLGLSKTENEKIMKLCKNECFNPSDERREITRIEVIKITPQNYNDEPVENLIQDVWKVHKCKPNSQGECRFRFSDPDYSKNGRDSLYYVRAIEEPSLRINGGNLRCDYDENGNCKKVNICYGGYQTDRNDNCTMLSEERAWSSPIYINQL